MPDREKVIKALETEIMNFTPACTSDERLKETMEMALELLKEQEPTVSGWVSVKDRMPDKPCSCLVFNIYGWRALDRWDGDDWMIADENEITHWMPLPEPPEVSENG